MMYQQGDVLFESVDEVNGDEFEVKGLLVEGELTGHSHRVAVEDLEKVEVLKQFEQMFVKVNAPAKIVHEEHKTVELPVGNYEIRKVREYDYWADEIRSVED